MIKTHIYQPVRIVSCDPSDRKHEDFTATRHVWIYAEIDAPSMTRGQYVALGREYMGKTALVEWDARDGVQAVIMEPDMTTDGEDGWENVESYYGRDTGFQECNPVSLLLYDEAESPVLRLMTREQTAIAVMRAR